MRFWSASGEDVDRLTLVSDDPPELVRASKPYRDAVDRARKQLEKAPATVTISHHDNDADDVVTIVYSR